MAKISNLFLALQVFSESDMTQARKSNVYQSGSKTKRKNKHITLDLQFLMASPNLLHISVRF